MSPVQWTNNEEKHVVNPLTSMAKKLNTLSLSGAWTSWTPVPGPGHLRLELQ